MSDEPTFCPDLFSGTAEVYDRYRLGYPLALVDDLVGRVHPSGSGRLLDLACGTGQLTFALEQRFGEVWAVDQEPDMIAMVTAKATSAGCGHVEALVVSAEQLVAPSAGFEFVTAANAFHRLRRDLVARRIFEWLHPGGHAALVWSSTPWIGDAAWQRALKEFAGRWVDRLQSGDRIPPGWDTARQARPDAVVMVESGFEHLCSRRFPTEHRWTIEELGGLMRSTSFLAAPVIADLSGEFEDDLARVLAPYATAGGLIETVDYSFELFGRP